MIDKLKAEIDELRKEVSRLNDMVKSIRGAPIINGFATKRFDLNDNLNVIELNKRFTAIERRLSALDGGV
jgi:cell fate (sporulation/competence/biofilm development) regulator YmcA (YheA/YmcA/DUF963 family)